MNSNNSSNGLADGAEESISNESNINGMNANIFEAASEVMELSWYGYAICITTMLFIWVVGSAGNFLVIYVVCKEKQLQTPMNMFLVNLSLADFITSAFGSPFPLIASIYHRWPFGETMCIIYAFGMSLGGITSITTLMVLAFERYLMIARPFRAADIRIYQSSAIIVSIWFYSLVLTLPPLIGWASYGPEGPYLSCSVSWEKNDLATKTYICYLFVLGLVLPLITITLSYIGIVRTIKSTSQTGTRTATARAELHVTLMVAIMITCFLIAWSPYAIVSLIVSFGGPREKQLITPLVAILPAICAKSATCYNPVIYVGLNTQFQNAWMKIFGIHREEGDPQTGLTASIGATTTATAPTKSGKLGISPSAEVAEHNTSHTITRSPYSVQEIDVRVTVASLINANAESIEKSNEGNSASRETTTLELLPLPHSSNDQQEEEIPQNNDIIINSDTTEGNMEDTSNSNG